MSNLQTPKKFPIFHFLETVLVNFSFPNISLIGLKI